MPEDLVDAATRLLRDGVAPSDFPHALTGEPPLAMLRRALDPDDRSIGVVAWKGQRLAGDLRQGDVLLRHGPTRAPRIAVIADPTPLSAVGMRRLGIVTEGPLPGRYVRVVEPGSGAAMGFARRVAGPDGLMLHDTAILRHAGEGADETVALSPPAHRTIRVGSSGPDVADAQARLNAAHAARLRDGQPGLNRCPLTVDGRFGANTRGAVVAFQQAAFPATPSAWDGIVGPQTWAALDANGGEIQGLPTRCPGLHQHETIDRFAFNSADVLPIHQPQIIGISRCIIESRTSATPITHLTIIGHTDPVGSDPDNDALGLRRAEAVKREIFAAIKRMTGRDARGLVIDTETRGKSQHVPGDDAANRRVEIVNAFDFIPGRTPVPVSTATVAFVLDTAGNHRVDAASPVATAVMFGLWDQAYDAAGDVRNGRAETANFIGLDARRFYLRVADPGATGSEIVVNWRTLNAARANDDAPASQAVTLTETSAGSKIFVSRALLLVVDDTDVAQATDSGLPAGHAQAGSRTRGQRDHRLRRAALDGFVRADYTPAGGVAAVTVERPVFARTPDARRRVRINVINYGTHATAAQIATQFANANLRWRQAGLVIDAGAAVARPIPAGVLNGAGRYTGSIDNAAEVAALADLIPAATDATLTVVFVRLANGANAYTTVGQRNNSALADRSFIFIDPDVDPQQLTLAHEFHHALFNRFDTGIDTPQISERPFFTFNTLSPTAYGVALPDDRVYRRIQSLHAADPNNDAANDHIVNWIKRRRTQRFPIPAALAAPDATTGNLFVEAF